MPKFNHPTFGDVQSHVYLEGKVLAVYLEDAAIPEAKWDTADVEYENHKVFFNAPIRYHCGPTGIDRANGAIVDGGRGFDVDDKVILMAKIGTTPGMGEEYPIIYVVAHRFGAIPCAYNYLLIRMSANDLIPHAPPYGTWINGVYTPTAPGSHLHEYVAVWDAKKGAAATIYNPVTKLPYVFPVSVEDFKPAFDGYRFSDEELFALDSQGDAQSAEAGFTPDWTSDIQGKKIMAGLPIDAWWTSYDFYGNPLLNLMFNAQMALASDSAGASDGTFAKAMEKINAGAENIAKWKALSPQAFNDQMIISPVKGSDEAKVMPPAVQARLQALSATVGQMNDLMEPLKNTPLDPNYIYYKGIRDTAQTELTNILAQNVFTAWAVAHDKDMKPLNMSSYHMQFAYGEDEVWVCGKNVYMGIVVSYCDAKWKFVRLRELPPAIPIVNSGLERLLNGGFYPSGVGTGRLIADVSFALASIITVGDDNNLFSWGTLKRINDGGFHRTTHPALKTAGVGSWRLTQNKIPLAPTEPVFITALNTRTELIDIWSRYDNWMNTIQCSAATYGVDRTWWFLSNAQQWRILATFIDTPIGSMWHSSPVWEAALWYMAGFNIMNGGPTCRRDAPLRTQFIRQTKHTKRVAAQVYIVQRQAVTMWDDPARTFVRQELNKGICDHFDPADIKYVAKDPDGLKNDDYNTLTDEQKKAQLTDRVYVRSQYPGEVGYSPPAALRNNRNEVEIMAACDLYSTLKTNFGRCHPNDQVRNGRLEYEIQKLVQKYYTTEALGLKDFSEFNFEARIV
jgi:hypothetical protein